jgi:hypothetical protein
MKDDDPAQAGFFFNCRPASTTQQRAFHGTSQRKLDPGPHRLC